MNADRLVLALAAGAVALVGLALAGLPAVATSVAGLAAFGAALAAELHTARERGVTPGALPRPAGLRYLAIAFPFLFLVSATGEEHLLAVVGAAVLTQASYVRAWRTNPARADGDAGRAPGRTRVARGR